MMMKNKWFCLILCICSVLTGCNKNTAEVKEKTEEEIVSMEERPGFRKSMKNI